MSSSSSIPRKSKKTGAGRKAAAAAPEEDGRAMAQMPLGKQLAHTDKKVRDAAIRNLEAFLSQTNGDDGAYVPLPEKEMAKLWKGLFYCFWMSDKPLVQQGLAVDLANLVLRINPVGAAEGAQLTAALAFLDGFWTALVREWNGIDRLRMDKYYMLIRRYVNATFRLLAREGWSVEAVDGVNQILSGIRGPMTWQDKSVPTSLATHIADIYLSELDAVLGEGLGPAPVVSLLAPHIALLVHTSQIVHKRLMNVLFTPLLDAYKGDDEDDDMGERPTKRRKASAEGSALSNIAANTAVNGKPVPQNVARSALLQALFKAAADEGAVETNRRKIYAIVRQEGDDDEE